MTLTSILIRRGSATIASRCRPLPASICELPSSRNEIVSRSVPAVVLQLRYMSQTTVSKTGDDENRSIATSNNISLDDDGGPIVQEDLLDFSSMTNEELADPTTIPGWDLVHCPPRSMPRGALVGTVVSDKMDKTVNVAVDRFRIVEKYRKRLKYTRKFMAHDEAELSKIGDTVMIVPCQRISKNKHFMVREIINAKGQL